MNKVFTISISISFLIIGIIIGYNYRIFESSFGSINRADMSSNSMSNMTNPIGEVNPKYYDLEFIDKMISYHQDAVNMAYQAQSKSNRDEVKKYSEGVINVRNAEIDKLYEFKKAYYNSDKKVVATNLVNLGDSDEKFDLRFINAMVVNNTLSMNLAREIIRKSTHTDILNLSDTIQTRISEEIYTLNANRVKWYQINNPFVM